MIYETYSDIFIENYLNTFFSESKPEPDEIFFDTVSNYDFSNNTPPISEYNVVDLIELNRMYPEKVESYYDTLDTLFCDDENAMAYIFSTYPVVLGKSGVISKNEEQLQLKSDNLSQLFKEERDYMLTWASNLEKKSPFFGLFSGAGLSSLLGLDSSYTLGTGTAFALGITLIGYSLPHLFSQYCLYSAWNRFVDETQNLESYYITSRESYYDSAKESIIGLRNEYDY